MIRAKHLATSMFVAFTAGILCSAAFADGTETLGPSTLATATGTGTIQMGIGTDDFPIGVIEFTVPDGATVEQAILYWEGSMDDPDQLGETEVVSLDIGDGNGDQPVPGQLIGGETDFVYNGFITTYRADITDRVGGGYNRLVISGLPYDDNRDGAGVIIVIDDGSEAKDIQIQDGNDGAYFDWPAPLDTMAPVTFTFDASDVDRDGDLILQVGGVTNDDGLGRTTTIDVEVYEGNTLVNSFLLADKLVSSEGAEWDVYSILADPNASLLIPAGADSLTFQLDSRDAANGNPFEGRTPASMVMLASTLELPAANSDDESDPCRVFGCAYGVDGCSVFGASGYAASANANNADVTGVWRHRQFWGYEGRIRFEAGTCKSAPGTGLLSVECSDPGGCDAWGKAPAKQTDVTGIGSFRKLRWTTPTIAAAVTRNQSLHFFEVHIEDLSSPTWCWNGSSDDGCADGGSAGQEATCGCPDFYSIKIHATEDPDSDVIYEKANYISWGNYRIRSLPSAN
jgi:hypothetical protein